MNPCSSSRIAAFVVCLAAVSGVVIAPRVARADPTSADIETARRLFTEGLDLRKKGDEAGALLKLEGAFDLTKSPVVGVEVAHCELALGKLVDARQTALDVYALPISAKETKASEDARAEAAKMADELKPRIAFVNVRLVNVPSGATPRITIDGVPVPATVVGQPRAVDPGKHVVAASVASESPAAVGVVMAEGESREVTLNLAGHGADVGPTPATPIEAAPLPASGSSDKDKDKPPAVASKKPATKTARVELGARTGYGLPMGDADGATSMADAIGNQIPLWIDLGVALPQGFVLGGYFEYGLVSIKSGGPLCPNGASCSAHDLRVGAEVAYHFDVGRASSDPWIGVGIGYEWLSYSLTASTGTTSASGDETVKGLELLNLQLGYDYRVAPTFALGPFLAFSVAKYTDYSFTTTIGGIAQPEKSGSIDNAKTHNWLMIGIRGAFRI
jgi:hypothetical protein